MTRKRQILERPEDDPEEDDASVSSDSMYQSNGHDTDRTHRTNISNRNHRRNQRKQKEHRFRHPTNAKEGGKIGIKVKVVTVTVPGLPEGGRPDLYRLVSGSGGVSPERIRR